jgi:hypothetical protein
MIKKNLSWVSDSNSSSADVVVDDFVEYKDFILKNSSFVKVLSFLNLHFEACITGKYTHRMTCPFQFHKNGQERTASFRFNDNTNRYMCYGCSSKGNVLDFLSIYVGGGDEYNLRRLASINGLINDGILNIPSHYISTQSEFSKQSNINILSDIGMCLRQYLLDVKTEPNYAEECIWIDQLFMKVDEYFATINEDDIENAKKIFANLKKTIEKRKMVK